MEEKQDEKFMKLAIEEAKKSTEPLKCGVVIVKNGKIIAQAYNSQKTSNNASAHAEIKAIGIAGQKVGSKKLNGCNIYCTCEPCIMCASAITFAEIDKLFYGTSLAEVSPINKRIDIPINEFLKKAPHQFVIVKNFLEKECSALIEC